MTTTNLGGYKENISLSIHYLLSEYANSFQQVQLLFVRIFDHLLPPKDAL